jgi:organic radical activating enzyme
MIGWRLDLKTNFSMQPNSSCKFLSNGIKFEVTENQKEIVVKPCCKWQDGPVIALESSVQQYQLYRNSVGHKNYQNLKWCNACVRDELAGAKSMRKVADLLVSQDSQWGDPTHVEFQFDTTCNAACIMCGPKFSSLWRQQSHLVKNIHFQPIEFDPMAAIMQRIDIQKIRSIAFVGGEPMLTRHDITLLQAIQQPELVTLAYVTNGSIYPGFQKQELWQRFKKVKIALSLDGVGARYDYVRYPLEWTQVQDNVSRMRSDMPWAVFFTNYTANILNFYYYQEFHAWLQQSNLTSSVPHYNIANGILSPNSVPPKLARLVIDRYGVDHQTSKTVLKTSNNHTEVVNYLDKLDQQRQTNWRQTFPEVASCFD